MAKSKKSQFAIVAGERIRAARKGYYRDRIMTLMELSQKTDGALTDRAISNYEQGIRQVGVEEALILSKALGPSAAYLLGVAEQDDLGKQERELLRAWRDLPEKERNQYYHRIVALAQAYREPIPEEKPPTSNAKPKRPKPR